MTVLDANDNAPRFLTDKFEASVNETAERGTVVLQVMARDEDVGNNGLVRLISTFAVRVISFCFILCSVKSNLLF